MTHEELTPRIQKIFDKVFGPKVNFHRTLSRTDEPRWTSLKHIELLIALEKEFNVRFDGGDATEMTNVAVIIEKLLERVP